MEQMFLHEPFWLKGTEEIRQMDGRKVIITTVHGTRISTLLRVIAASDTEERCGDCKILAVRHNEEGSAGGTGRASVVRALKWSRYLGVEAISALLKAAPSGPDTEILLHIPKRDLSVPLGSA